ncbi:MAG TPA: IS481 family transposase [Miltoncostaeaceae bacterium]|nr:IS481 family transposase [Miltoncostaeaceae bacterium]
MRHANERPRRKRLSWESRCEIVAKVRLQGMSPGLAAASSGVHRSTAYRLVARFDQGGWAALVDRAPVPHRQPRRLSPELERRILSARAASRYGPARLGATLGIPASTVAKVLRRAGASRLPRPPRPRVVRYERERPGELLHVDTKRLGRFHQVGKRILADGLRRSPNAGWQHLHVAIDDHTRVAYCEVLAGQGAEASCAFLGRAVAWFKAEHGISIERVLSDNGHAYRSHAWRDLCERLGIERRRTRPYTPRTNGKAEALIGTMLREWAYRYAYPTSSHRARALSGWVRWYNRRRPHSSLGDRPPISRVAQVRGQFS